MKITAHLIGDLDVGIPPTSYTIDIPELMPAGIDDEDHRTDIRMAVLDLAQTIAQDTAGIVVFEDECSNCYRPIPGWPSAACACADEARQAEEDQKAIDRLADAIDRMEVGKVYQIRLHGRPGTGATRFRR